MTLDGARRYLLGLLPPGALDFYDDSASGDLYLIFDAIAQMLKTYGYDLLDTLRKELFPSTTEQKLPDWEGATGISKGFPALFGSTAQRRSAVVAKIRECGPFSDPIVASVIGPLLGYFPTTAVQIVKSDRSALRLLHTWPLFVDTTIAGSTTIRVSVRALTGGKLAKCGAVLDLNFSGSAVGYTIKLTAPDPRQSKTWIVPAGAMVPLRLFATELSGTPVFGTWSIDITNPSGTPNTLFSGPTLFAEGIGRGEETGSAIFHTGVYVDPAHIGESGSPPDVTGVRAALLRMKHAHTVCVPFLSLAPRPGVQSGVHAAIPGMCVPS